MAKPIKATPTLSGKDADRFIKKMIAKEKSKPTKKEKEMAEQIRKNFPTIEHKIVEEKDYVMPVFWILITLFVLTILSYICAGLIYQDTNSVLITTLVLIVLWSIWIYGVVKNRLWRPEKIISVEHVIVGMENENERKNKKPVFQLWKR